MNKIKCKMKGACFAKDKKGYCTILNETSENCKFQKPYREITDGKRYKTKTSILVTGYGNIEYRRNEREVN